MKLYTRRDASSVIVGDDTYPVGDDGTVEVPEDLGRRLRDTHVGGVKAWEDETERHARLLAEESERRKDPATLLAAVEALAAQVATPRPRRTKAAP